MGEIEIRWKKKRLLGCIFDSNMFMAIGECADTAPLPIQMEEMTKSTISASNQPGLFEVDFPSFYLWLATVF